MKLEQRKQRLLEPIYEAERGLSHERAELHKKVLFDPAAYGLNNPTEVMAYFISL